MTDSPPPDSPLDLLPDPTAAAWAAFLPALLAALPAGHWLRVLHDRVAPALSRAGVRTRFLPHRPGATAGDWDYVSEWFSERTPGADPLDPFGAEPTAVVHVYYGAGPGLAAALAVAQPDAAALAQLAAGPALDEAARRRVDLHMPTGTQRRAYLNAVRHFFQARVLQLFGDEPVFTLELAAGAPLTAAELEAAPATPAALLAAAAAGAQMAPRSIGACGPG